MRCRIWWSRRGRGCWRVGRRRGRLFVEGRTSLSRRRGDREGESCAAPWCAASGATVEAGDRFNANRIGLDHLSLSVEKIADLESAVQLLDERAVEHGTVNLLGALGLQCWRFGIRITSR